MVRGLLRLCVGLGSEPDDGARTWPLWPCPSAPTPQLVCSLAYSATGSLTQSEDLAQETFVSAWKDLRLLCEPLVLFYREHVSSRAWLVHPERKVPVWRWTLAALCAVTLLAVNLRWQRWAASIWARDFGPLCSSQLGVNVGLVLLYAILGFCLSWNWKTR